MRLEVFRNIFVRYLDVLLEILVTKSHDRDVQLPIRLVVVFGRLEFGDVQPGPKQILEPVEGKLIRDQFLELGFGEPERRKPILDKVGVFIEIKLVAALKGREGLDKSHYFSRVRANSED